MAEAEERDPALTAVTLAQAQAIAETEHPDSAVVRSVPASKKEPDHVFLFDNGWSVHVRANDGTVVRVQDATGKDRPCRNRHKESGVYGGEDEHFGQRMHKHGFARS